MNATYYAQCICKCTRKQPIQTKKAFSLNFELMFIQAYFHKSSQGDFKMSNILRKTGRASFWFTIPSVPDETASSSSACCGTQSFVSSDIGANILLALCSVVTHEFY